MTLQEILASLRKVRRSGEGYVAQCCSHEDKNPSLSIREVNGKVLLYCHAGCSYEAILAALGESRSSDSLGDGGSAGLRSNAERPANKRAKVESDKRDPKMQRKEIVAEYPYHDEQGREIYWVVRFVVHNTDGTACKEFRVKRRARSGEESADGWIFNVKDLQLVPYNLPAVIDAQLVYIVEGEKDVEAMKSKGLIASCNPFGAGKWRDEYSEWFRDKLVAILPDNDEPGSKHAEQVAASLHGIAKEVLIISLPDLPPKGDVSDFFDAGGTADDLMDLVQRGEPWSKRLGKLDTNVGFNFTDLPTMLSEPPEAVSFVWDDTLPTAGFSICSGKPKTGKSTFARNLAVAVANGVEFLGRPTTRCRVLYLGLEEKRPEIAAHFRRMAVDTARILVHTGRTPHDAILGLEAAILEFDPGLVVIDPLSRIVRVPDFNDYGPMSRGLEPLIDLGRKTGAHILALHHDSKMDRNGGDALLGSTAIFAAVDCHIQIKKREQRRTVLTTQRYGTDLPETLISLDGETGRVAALGDLAEVNSRRLQEEIIASMSSDEKADETAIKARIEGHSQGEISKAIRVLVSDGKLNRSGNGRKGNPYQYYAVTS